jgi:quinoprotein glucose dehydrogenase
VVPVVERPVPQGGAPGEVLAPTTIRPRDAFGILPWGNDRCRRAIAAARHEGLYTPPSLQGAILYPFTGGGVNWGGLAFDAGRQYVVIAAGGHARTDTRRGDQVIAYALPR